MTPSPRSVRYGIALSLAGILLLCLLPSGDQAVRGVQGCVLCGETAVATLILNVLLYVPLGFFVLLGTRSLPLAVLTGFLLSLSVETAQLWIPGRHTTLADLLANTAGAGLGALLASRLRVWLFPNPSAQRTLLVAGSGASILVLAGTGFLLTPSFPGGAWYAQWTPENGVFERYGGEVLEAEVEGVTLGPGEVGAPDRVLERLRRGAPVELHFVAGPAPGRPAPVFRLVNWGGREALQVVQDRRDLVLRWYFYADALGMSRPDLRVRESMAAMAVGDTVHIGLAVLPEGGFRARIGTGPPLRLGHTAGRGWSVLRYSTGWGEPVLRGVDLFWLGMLFLPIGWWATSWRQRAWASALPLGVLVTLPVWTPLLVGPPGEVVAAVSGVGLGWALRSAARRRVERPRTGDSPAPGAGPPRVRSPRTGGIRLGASTQGQDASIRG